MAEATENKKAACVIMDIDHTISDAFWRDGMIGTQDWDYYHQHAAQDFPLYDMVELIDAMHNDGIEIIGCTARPEKWRKATMDWLIKHDIPMDQILMRSDDEFRSSPEIKLELVIGAIDRGEIGQVLCVFDDRDDVIAAFRAAKFTCLQVYAIGANR